MGNRSAQKIIDCFPGWKSHQEKWMGKPEGLRLFLCEHCKSARISVNLSTVSSPSDQGFPPHCHSVAGGARRL